MVKKRKVRIGIEGLIAEKDGEERPYCTWISHVAETNEDGMQMIVYGKPELFTTDKASYLAKFLLKQEEVNVYIYDYIYNEEYLIPAQSPS